MSYQLSYKRNSNVNTFFSHSKNEWSRMFDLKVTLPYYYMKSYYYMK